jgi:cysteine-rich repeat protein
LYYLNTSTQICEDICGDGFQIYVYCDDGNLINGDGCSDSCQVENDYTCVGGSITSPSACSYSGPIYLVVESTFKN